MSDSDSDSFSGSDIDLPQPPQPLPAIHAAVRSLDVDALHRALAAGANADVLDEEGYTPLYVACKATSLAKAIREEKVREREAIVAALLRAGANVNIGGGSWSFSGTPLIGAVWDNRGPPSSIVAQLIAAGADIEATDNGFFVLYTAAQSGSANTVSRLLAAGADPHRRLRNPELTVLEGATLTRNVRAYAPLLRAGATLPPSRHHAYLNKIAATPGGYPAYERAHRTRLAAIFVPKFPRLPVEVIHHIVSIWADCGGH